MTLPLHFETVGPAGFEPATNAFRFVSVSRLPGLYLHHGPSRFRWWPSSLYTFLSCSGLARDYLASCWASPNLTTDTGRISLAGHTRV